MQKKSKSNPKHTNGHQASTQVREVNFAFQNADAKEVYVCGDFNQWSPAALRMIRHEQTGRWEKRLVLRPGRYEYKFIVDGEWIPDPEASQDVVNAFGSINSVKEVFL